MAEPKAESDRLCGACYDGEHRAHRPSEGCDCVKCSPIYPPEVTGG